MCVHLPKPRRWHLTLKARESTFPSGHVGVPQTLAPARHAGANEEAGTANQPKEYKPLLSAAWRHELAFFSFFCSDE